MFSSQHAIGVTTECGDVAWVWYPQYGMQNSRKTKETEMANARLIAASPKMLAALECFVAACEGVNSECSDLHEATELAKAAIAEATGRTA